jgi:hypothetical protein
MWGEGMTGFTFTAGRVAVPVPEPSAPGPVAVPHPTIVMARIRASAETEGSSTILVDGKMIVVGRGVHFDLDSIPGSVKMTGGAFEVTVKKQRVVRAKKSASLRTATGAK